MQQVLHPSSVRIDFVKLRLLAPRHRSPSGGCRDFSAEAGEQKLRFGDRKAGALRLVDHRQNVEYARIVSTLATGPRLRIGGLPGPVRALFDLRFFLGRIFRLEDQPKGAGGASFAQALTAEDRARSSLASGTPDGLFRVVYRFENEALLEMHNRTVHAALLMSLAETEAGHRFYLAVCVCKASWITPVYMALIDPFRRWIIYPAVLKNIRAIWAESAEMERSGWYDR